MLTITQEDILYAFLDSKLDIQWLGVIQRNISIFGYTYISECIFKEYYSKKQSLKRTAKVLGVSEYTAYRWMGVIGFKPRKAGGYRYCKFSDPNQIAIIRRIHKSGMPIKQIAVYYHCSANTIRRLL